MPRVTSQLATIPGQRGAACGQPCRLAEVQLVVAAAVVVVVVVVAVVEVG